MTASVQSKQQQSRQTERPSKTWLAKAVSIVLCQVLAILFVEFVLFLAGMGEEEIFKFDPEIGFQHMADKRVTWRTEGFAQSYLNSDGMREANLTVAKPENTYRVALLGDSMVEGLQVPIESTFGAIIGRRLSPLNGKQVQVLNFGTSGYSTAQEYLQLKKQVLKYRPDLVIACYDSRDIFENWASPDQVITNVRPMAIHLPNSYLVVDSLPVKKWFNTPRAKVLQATEWLRHHSRIVGLLTALDLEWSQHNVWYRAFVASFSRPKVAIQEFQKAWALQNSSGPSFKIKFFEDAPALSKKKVAESKPVVPVEVTAAKPVFNSASSNATLSEKPVFNSAASNETLAVKPIFNSASSNETLATKPALLAATTPDKTVAKQDPQLMYRELIARTLGSLYKAMSKDCAESGARFVVMSLPVRSQLCPLIGMETEFSGIDYAGELHMVRTVCTEANVPFFDCAKLSETLPKENRETLFYTVHLTPQGQQFIADSAQQFVSQQLSSPRQ